jgi:ribonuclease HI
VLRYGDHEKELRGFEPVATSQRMELIAATKGLEALHNPSKVHLFSDSQYLVNGMNQWIHGWVRNGKLDEPDALANQDLWKQLQALAQKHDVAWEWVRGHAGHPFNERCDRLAKRAVEEGEQLAEAARQLEATIKQQEAVDSQVVSPKPEAVPIREESDFEADEDGQFRLC